MRAARYLITSFFTTLINFVVLTSAYGDYGAYERVFYYYVYKIDGASGKGGMPTEWATGCAKVIGTGGRPCNFNQFIQYITAKEKGNMISLPDIHGDLDSLPPVRATADTLQEKGLTGVYDIKRMHNEPPNVEALFRKAMAVVQARLSYGNWPDTAVRDALRGGAYDAMRAITDLRLKARAESFMKEWGKNQELKDITPAKPTRQLATGETVEMYNPAQTVTENPTKENAIRAFHEYEDKRDPTHSGNVKMANKARNMLNPAHKDAIQCYT